MSEDVFRYNRRRALCGGADWSIPPMPTVIQIEGMELTNQWHAAEHSAHCTSSVYRRVPKGITHACRHMKVGKYGGGGVEGGVKYYQ